MTSEKIIIFQPHPSTESISEKQILNVNIIDDGKTIQFNNLV
jgi:hypothetical protein